MPDGSKPRSRRIRPLLLILLWIWAVLVFVILDLFWTIDELDAVRPRASIYEGMRAAAHKMVGEPLPQEFRSRPQRRSQIAMNRGPEADPTRRWVGNDAYEPGDPRYLVRQTYSETQDPDTEPVESDVRDGQRQGKWLWQWPNGTDREVRRYKDGALNGMVSAWYENGFKQIHEEYRSGKRHGKWLSYYQSGRPAVLEEYERGELTGRFVRWYENGVMAEESFFESGQRVGTWRVWDDRGQLEHESKYDDAGASN